MAAEPTCDICAETIFGPIYKACTSRPSDPYSLVSVMWACKTHAAKIGAHPDSYWEQVAEDRGMDYEG